LQCSQGFAAPRGVCDALVSTSPMALSLFLFALSHACLASSRCVCVYYKYPGERGCSGDWGTQMFVAGFQLLGFPRKGWFSGIGLLANLGLFPPCHSLQLRDAEVPGWPGHKPIVSQVTNPCSVHICVRFFQPGGLDPSPLISLLYSEHLIKLTARNRETSESV